MSARDRRDCPHHAAAQRAINRLVEAGATPAEAIDAAFTVAVANWLSLRGLRHVSHELRALAEAMAAEADRRTAESVPARH
ncbi:hypothetical protein OPKNFCMD_1302 [Methylobacterium crusticola]|uniref:Uncharacterized protein n=1 Tax=Methylobacterium crusticola TaxID=1697972 RepID=A0ABQ4QUY5_9HYPH|nr:hypothetical protein [Methylobacterium crusticola]GJD48580.1 hypothetical protein OPKNFCMD_1302 [Methylobacterium crusticola]